MLDRRHFLKSLAALTASATIPAQAKAATGDLLGEVLPLRKLGKTGEMVTMLGLGGFHVGAQANEASAQATIEAALEGGIRFFDNANQYQDGRAEEYFGRFLTPRYRDQIFLMTKSMAHDVATAREHLEQSMRLMKTDRIDLWQVHALGSPADADQRMDSGIVDLFVKMRDEGKVRYIGFTGHTSPEAHERMLERTDLLQTCQMPMNVLDPHHDHSFIRQVLPKLVEREMGVLAMKSLAMGDFFAAGLRKKKRDLPAIVPDRITAAEALHFVWSLPVSVLISGADNPGVIRENIQTARAFQQLDESQRVALLDKVADLGKAGKHEYYKRA